MKISFVLLIISIQLNNQFLQGADTYELGDTLYVWALSGLNVRSHPEVGAEKLGQLALGEWVEIISITDRNYSIKTIALYEDNIYREEGSVGPLVLNGTWVEIKSREFKGYVIDTYLLTYKTPPPSTSILGYFGDGEGDILTVDTTWVPDCDGAPIVDCYTYEGKSISGIKISGEYFMSSVHHSMSFPVKNMTLKEGFILCNFFYSIEDDIRKKKGWQLLQLIKIRENGVWFLKGDICIFSISVEEQKLTISEGCSC